MDGQPVEADPGLRIAVERPADGSYLIAATGELDVASTDALMDAIAAAHKEGARAMVLDIRGLGFMDSSGLRVLIDTWNECNLADRKLTIVIRKDGLVRRVLEVSGCDGILPLVEDADE